MVTSTDTAKHYLRAAEFIANGRNRRNDGLYDGACDTLYCSPYAETTSEAWGRRELFKKLFVNGHGFCLVDDILPIGEAQEWRVLALCFMAAMVEAGDA